MSAHPLAGKPAPKDLLIDVKRLEEAFYTSKPDPTDPNQLN
jgi:phosphoglucomutase